MYYHKEQNTLLNNLIKQLFHEENWEDRAEAARQLGFLKDGHLNTALVPV